MKTIILLVVLLSLAGCASDNVVYKYKDREVLVPVVEVDSCIKEKVKLCDKEINTYKDHTYKSTSNTPFEPDVYNKLVNLNVTFDDGWDENNTNKDFLINVKPNRITQNFITNPIRHLNDDTISDSIIVGDNPIEFYDNSITDRIDSNNNSDFSFIKNVKYAIIDNCI